MAVDINRVVASAIEAAFEGEEHHEPQRSESRHRGLKALAAGAALVATARVVSNHAPKLGKLGVLSAVGKAAHLPDMVRGAPDRLRDRLADSGWGDWESDTDVADEDLEDEEDYDEEAHGEPEDEAPEGEAEDEEPEGEAEDEEPEGEGGEGPDDEGGDWPDDEGEDQGGGGGGDAEEAEPDEDEQPQAAVSSGGSAIEQAAQGLDIDTNGHRASRRGAVPDVIGALSTRGNPPPLLASTERRRHIDPVTRPPEPPTKEGESRSSKSKSGSSSSKSKSGSTSSKSKSSSRRRSTSSSKSGTKKAKAGSR